MIYLAGYYGVFALEELPACLGLLLGRVSCLMCARPLLPMLPPKPYLELSVWQGECLTIPLYNAIVSQLRALSSVGERFVHTQEATGSKPVAPTRARLGVRRLATVAGHREMNSDGGTPDEQVVSCARPKLAAYLRRAVCDERSPHGSEGVVGNVPGFG